LIHFYINRNTYLTVCLVTETGYYRLSTHAFSSNHCDGRILRENTLRGLSFSSNRRLMTLDISTNYFCINE
jgi:hypothetical protein